jgi:hypothetical protein
MIPTLILLSHSLAPQPVETKLRGKPLLTDISRRAFDFFWKESPAPYYFTRDRAPNFADKKPREKSPASIAAVGYALSSNAIGASHGWVSRKAALNRSIAQVEAVLNKAPASKGWFYHFFDTDTGERMWNCELSTIDTSLLINGLMVAEGYFKSPKLTKLANQVYARIDWNYMLTDGGTKPDEKFFTMGYRPESGFIPARWNDYNELMHLYVAAYALWPDMPKDSWDKWARNPVEYKGIKLLRGGPLFLHQMAQGFYDFSGRRDRLGYDYWVAGRNGTLAQRQYCIDNPKNFAGYSANIWGLSACDVPDGYGAQGAPVDVTDNGTLAPVSATASVLYTPKESMDATEEFVTKYPASYGKYGFVTGMNPSKNWYAQDVIGIDLGQAQLNIENYLNGNPHKWMMSQPRVKKAMKIIGLSKTAEGTLSKRELYIPKAG